MLRSFIWRALAALFGLLLFYQLWIAAHLWWWVNHNPPTSAFMEHRLQLMQDKNPKAELRHKWVSYARISGNLKRALIASEDARFVDHKGFDWDGIEQALGQFW